MRGSPGGRCECSRLGLELGGGQGSTQAQAVRPPCTYRHPGPLCTDTGQAGGGPAGPRRRAERAREAPGHGAGHAGRLHSSGFERVEESPGFKGRWHPRASWEGEFPSPGLEGAPAQAPLAGAAPPVEMALPTPALQPAQVATKMGPFEYQRGQLPQTDTHQAC